MVGAGNALIEIVVMFSLLSTQGVDGSPKIKRGREAFGCAHDGGSEAAYEASKPPCRAQVATVEAA